MSFEISGMTDVKLQSWATKCDANGDGKIDGDELSIFSQGKENMHELGELKRTTVGGVTFDIDDIQTIQKNQNGDKFDYSVRFASGVKMQFDEQNEGNEAYAGSWHPAKRDNNKYTSSRFANITDGDGFSVKGTHLEDYFDIINSIIDKVDGLAHKDSVTIHYSKGNKNSGQIFAESGSICKSSGLSIKPSSQKFLLQTLETPAVNVSDKHPYAKWGN